MLEKKVGPSSRTITYNIHNYVHSQLLWYYDILDDLKLNILDIYVYIHVYIHVKTEKNIIYTLYAYVTVYVPMYGTYKVPQPPH